MTVGLVESLVDSLLLLLLGLNIIEYTIGVVLNIAALISICKERRLKLLLLLLWWHRGYKVVNKRIALLRGNILHLLLLVVLLF